MTTTVLDLVNQYGATLASTRSHDAKGCWPGGVQTDVVRLAHSVADVGAVYTVPRGQNGACDIEVFDRANAPIAFVVIDGRGKVEALPPVEPSPATEPLDCDSLHAARARAEVLASVADGLEPLVRCDATVYFRGRPAVARRVEPLPNGLWRADLKSSGLVVTYYDFPVDNPAARQHSA